MVERILSILENNGARTGRKWASRSTICRVVDKDSAHLLLRNLRKSNTFRDMVVNQCLPVACRDWRDDPFGFSKFFQGVTSSFVTTFRQASEQEVREVIEKAKNRIEGSEVVELVEQGRLFTVHEARKIVHGVADETTITDERAQKLLETIRPLIYGSTPLNLSLREAIQIFTCSGCPF